MLLAIFIVMQIAAAPSPPPKAVSVCELLARDATEMNGRIVSIRGLIGGTDEGTWLTGECKGHPGTGGVRWGNDLWVEIDTTGRVAMRSWNKMLGKMRAAHADWTQDRIWVTVVGRIETRASMSDEIALGPTGPRKRDLAIWGAQGRRLTFKG